MIKMIVQTLKQQHCYIAHKNYIETANNKREIQATLSIDNNVAYVKP